MRRHVFGKKGTASYFHLFLHLPCGQPFYPKDCRNRPIRNAAVFFKQNTRFAAKYKTVFPHLSVPIRTYYIPEDSIIFSGERIHTHTHTHTCCSSTCYSLCTPAHVFLARYVTIKVPFTVGTEPRD